MRILFTLHLLFCVSSMSIAQIDVAGSVKDLAGNALPGVNVLVKNTSQGTVTDTDGNYRITLPSDGTLLFSFIGYKTQEVIINGRSRVDVQLEDDVTSLEEIVVVGYGVQKKSVATASVSKVDSKDLEGFSAARLDQMLQGQVAGVTFKTADYLF